ncbi:hypothetical protein ACLOJK_029903 [Asimina triloba]
MHDEDALNPPIVASSSAIGPLSPPSDIVASASIVALVMDAPTTWQKQRVIKEKSVISCRSTASHGSPPLLTPLAIKVGGIFHLDVNPLEVPFKRSDTIVRQEAAGFSSEGLHRASGKGLGPALAGAAFEPVPVAGAQEPESTKGVAKVES